MQVRRECSAYDLRPGFSYDEEPYADPLLGTVTRFSCTVALPAVLKLGPGSSSFSTPALQSKVAAKAAAAFLACRALHERGLIDDDLNPVEERQQLRSLPHFEPDLDHSSQLESSRVELVTTSRHLGLLPVLKADTQAPWFVYRFRGHAAAAVGAGLGLGLLTKGRSLGVGHEHLDLVGQVAGRGKNERRAAVEAGLMLLHVAMQGRDAHARGGEEWVEEVGQLRAKVADQWDRGYLLTTLQEGPGGWEWAGSQALADLREDPTRLIRRASMWPLPPGSPADWLVYVPGRQGGKGRLFRVLKVTGDTLREGRERLARECRSREEGCDQAEEGGLDQGEEDMEVDEEEVDEGGAGDGAGVASRKRPAPTEPRLSLGDLTKAQLDALDQEQPLLLVEAVRDSAFEFTASFRGADPRKQPKPVLLVPELCSLSYLSMQLFDQLQAALPALWDVENDLKVRHTLLHGTGQVGASLPLSCVGLVTRRPAWLRGWALLA
jgi:hypothetical protein